MKNKFLFFITILIFILDPLESSSESLDEQRCKIYSSIANSTMDSRQENIPIIKTLEMIDKSFSNVSDTEKTV